MRTNLASICLTRVVIDARDDIHLAEWQVAVQRIQDALQAVVPPSHHTYIAHALLDHAVSHFVGARSSLIHR